ncbi:hypothetical protein RS130_05010 [Paraglaciecola aquimarina]|uniref:Smf/DprA SAM domain-containing protein n=1 Tax=Paraglaciecola aquimarina TaxID=1235557 RepID=A0ABU3STN7_9ALTE|nr:hypothetical protein [Paraglaciecola aquimarina]MDU0353374.1 hypothetical protein [Paraglaciecola aquimarina]
MLKVQGSLAKSDALLDWLTLRQIPRFSVASLTKLSAKYDVSLAELLGLPPKRLREMGFNESQISVIQQPDQNLIAASVT